MNIIAPLLLVAFLVAPFGFVFLAGSRIIAANRRRSRSPFTDKMLRPPGEGLRLRIEEGEERLILLLLPMVGIAFFPAICLLYPVLLGRPLAVPSALLYYAVVPVLSFAGALWYWRKTTRHAAEMRNWKLGFNGERCVAEALVPLVAQGYRVFHDVVMDERPGGNATNYNIDHLVVGPAGVFAVETKARRKVNGKAAKGEQQSHEIVYTGQTLRFPDGYQSAEWLDQARWNAKAVSEWLTGSSSVRVPVTPVLAVPGWFIERKGKSDVHVLTPKELAKTIPSLGREKLGPERVREIADRVEDKCRDVEA